MRLNDIPPLRVDFVVLAINDEETTQAKTILGLEHEQQEAGLGYDWGCVPHHDGSQVTVALVSFDDKQGETEAVERAHDIVSLLHPQYVLIIGTAGGLQRQSKEIQLGDVVISYIVNYGSFKTDPPAFRAKPILPPSLDLFKRARRVSQTDAWKAFVTIHSPQPASSKVVFKEICSTGINMSGINEPLLKLVTDNFPRTAAIEMEAGGVANHLFEAVRQQKRIPDYLVIKGISDISDAPRPEAEKHDENTLSNQQERDTWRSYASNVSAAFARALISSFSPARRRPVDIERVRPSKLRSAIKINHDCSGVFYNVQPEEYSELAAYHLKRVGSHSPQAVPQFFTVCAYDPKTLWQIARQRYVHTMAHQPTDDELTTWTLREFKHFTVFKEHAITGDGSPNHSPTCVRILLLDDFKQWTSSENLDQRHWDFFKKLAEGVPCWGIDRRSVSKVLYLTDYVIIGGSLVLSYYHDSSTLIVTELADQAVSRDILRLQNMFYQDGSGDPFRALMKLDAEATTAFEGRLKQAATEISH